MKRALGTAVAVVALAALYLWTLPILILLVSGDYTPTLGIVLGPEDSLLVDIILTTREQLLKGLP